LKENRAHFDKVVLIFGQVSYFLVKLK